MTEPNTVPAFEPRCDCCDLPAFMCGKAAQDRQRAEQAEQRAALLRRPGWFAALYPGRCCWCHESFVAGTPIAQESQESGDNAAYVAQCCAQEAG